MFQKWILQDFQVLFKQKCTVENNMIKDPYVKLYLHHQNTRSAKKKTHIKKRSLNPVFNESFIFDLPSKDGSLDEVQLEIIMCDWDRITKNEV